MVLNLWETERWNSLTSLGILTCSVLASCHNVPCSPGVSTSHTCTNLRWSFMVMICTLRIEPCIAGQTHAGGNLQFSKTLVKVIFAPLVHNLRLKYFILGSRSQSPFEPAGVTSSLHSRFCVTRWCTLHVRNLHVLSSMQLVPFINSRVSCAFV